MVDINKKVPRFSKDQVKQFIEQGQLKSMEDVQGALRDLFSQTLSAMLEGEMDHHLGVGSECCVSERGCI